MLAPLRKAQAETARLAAIEAVRVAEEHRVAQLAIVRAKTIVAAPVMVPVAPTGTHADWMLAAGIDPANFGYVDYIVTHESGWRWWITNNEGSGATGLGQALPAIKMAPFGADYLTNPITQLRWAQAYAIGRYGSWAAAYGYWVAHRVW